MNKWLKFLIPHFTTDFVAVVDNDDILDILCLVEHLYEDEREIVAGVACIRCFTWLGFGFFGKQIGGVLTLEEFETKMKELINKAEKGGL